MDSKILGMVVASLIVATLVFAEDNNGKPAPKYEGRIKAEATLDLKTGRVTYLLRNLSDEIVRIHLKSVQTAQYALSIEPAVDMSKIELKPGDAIDPYEGAFVPFGVEPSYHVAGTPIKKEPVLDRAVELKKGEAVSKSFLIWKAPWWEKLVAELKKRKYKEYRINPRPTIYTADKQGKPVRDHHISVWIMERGADGKLGPVFKTKGFTIDLKLARKLKSLQAEAKKKAESETKESTDAT